VPLEAAAARKPRFPFRPPEKAVRPNFPEQRAKGLAALARLWPQQFAKQPNILTLAAVVIQHCLERLRVENDPARQERLVKKLEVLLARRGR
jgi:hypothetical protein